ncbi:hypothetical protein I7I48_01173 [Histoplasma ohiense]|nr:hypothetical protein I7I48_01173 [Histoplasma ohiense (nom. inval.)]
MPCHIPNIVPAVTNLWLQQQLDHIWNFSIDQPRNPEALVPKLRMQGAMRATKQRENDYTARIIKLFPMNSLMQREGPYELFALLHALLHACQKCLLHLASCDFCSFFIISWFGWLSASIKR